MAEPKFEKDLEKLEKIVEELEEGGLPLDTALKKFEEGIGLVKRCEKALDSAEKKIEVLTRNEKGDLAAKPFEAVGREESENADDSESSDDEEDEHEMLF